MPVSSKHLNEILSNQERVKKTDLFALWPGNRRYYRVTLDKLDKAEKTATVHFEDGKSHDCPISELHLQFLETDPYEAVDEVVCCICDGDKTGKQNEIVICDTCQQGYHQKCHNPKIPNSLLQPEHEDDDWACATCDYMVDCHLKKETKVELYASTPRVNKKPKKPERQIKLPPPARNKEVKPEPGEKPKSQETVEAKEDPGNQVVVLEEIISAEQQARELARLEECEPADKHLSMIAHELLNRNAEAIQTPDLVEAIASKDPVRLVGEEPKPTEAPKTGQGPKEAAFKPVSKVPTKKATKLKKTETAARAPRKNMPIAA